MPLLLAGLAACTTTSGSDQQAEINNNTKFAAADLGVPASPRVTTKKTTRIGGGHYQVGKPYEVAGHWYHPKLNPDYNKVGVASWYGPNFHGRLTANGEVYNEYNLTAASTTLPLPCYARVTNESTGDSVIVRVNDRGPFKHGRIIDVSTAAAKLLHMRQAGTAKVRVKYVGLAPLDKDDSSYLMASYRPGEDGAPAVDPDTGQSGVMVAMNDTTADGLPGVTMEDDATAASSATLPTSASAMTAVPTMPPAQQSIRTALLPRVGPLPSLRPTLSASADENGVGTGRPTAVAAYASERPSATEVAFNKVLDDDDQASADTLTAAAIVRAWNRGMIASN